MYRIGLYLCYVEILVIASFQERDQTMAKIGDSAVYFGRFSILGLTKRFTQIYIEKTVLL